MKNMFDKFIFENGKGIPCIGFGTYLAENGDMAINAVKEAINAGYRHIDTASFYNNEESIGLAVKKSGIKREEIFVTSKLWNADRGYLKTKEAFKSSLLKFGFDYIDLYLIHWPANKKQFKDADEINSETWKAFEELYREGFIKAIGLSNFLPHHIETLLKTAEIKPMVNQIEFHPGVMQKETVDYCMEKGILVEAWGPLGRQQVLSNETLKCMAEKYGKTPAQICIRWSLQHNVLPLPKSITVSRIVENTDVFDFIIDERDMEIIDRIPFCGGKRMNPDEIDF